MSPLLLDHLWQSTLVLIGIGLLTFFFRRNGAHVRHGLWMAASLKFLVPFALLNVLGSYLAQLTGLKLPSLSVIETLYAAGQPFSDGSVFVAMPSPQAYLLPGTIIWIAGMIAVAGYWLSGWLKLRATQRAARDADIGAPMPVKISTALMEPGLVGIFRAVLLLPEGIVEKLSPAEMKSVVAHEAAHMRRHDNLGAVLHMLVETVFWFWPPIWWLGTRLIVERERACDEAVLAAGHDPKTYATSILKVCKFYVQSPLACAAGIAGANLNHRMETIMADRLAIQLNGMKKALLCLSATALVLTPLAAGLFWSPAEAATCSLDPVRETHTLVPFPEGSIKANETGIVTLQVTVARNGHVQNAIAVHSSGFKRLDRGAADYVRQHWLWQPQACKTAKTMVKVVFRLRPPASPTSNP